MLAEKQIQRMLDKLIRFETTLENMMFQTVDQVSMDWYQTKERWHEIPEQALFKACSPGKQWGGVDTFCWFLGTYTPKKEQDGKKLYLYPKTTGYEALLWVNKKPSGIYAAKFVEHSHGNHYCNMLVPKAIAGEEIEIALEYFAGNFCIGSKPLINEETRTFSYETGTFDVCIKDELAAEFYFDLKVLNQLVSTLDSNSFRRAEVIRGLMKVHEIVYYSPEDVEEKVFREALITAHPFLKKELEKGNADSAPKAGVIGHSHMDTAWLWSRDETIKKCARTYANQLSLMEQYPEYLFVQSSAFHTETIRRHYPELFERIKERVREGRYEPNGGVWVECDCNIPTGEMMARQFLWGQRYTQQNFGYLSDTFWLPDTFGYSAAIPQIMKQSGIKYFLTTKIDWNDTNVFPYDSFYWIGIDGTKVLTHFNKSHVWPDPKSLIEFMVTGNDFDNCVKEKVVTDRRLFSFGYGDGGGGPQFEMIEMTKRLKDVDGIPKVTYTTVSDFMQELEETVTEPSAYSGELYLELHRGTLTNQHMIKRNNRLAEIALHNLEYFTVRKAMEDGRAASGQEINPRTETLLVNQFHDILPGTCIPVVHERCIDEVGAMIKDADRLCQNLISDPAKDTITVSNTTSLKRDDVVYLNNQENSKVKGEYRQQKVTTLKGEEKLAVAGVSQQPFSSVCLQMEHGEVDGKSVFVFENNRLETPFGKIVFDENGYIKSFCDKTAGNRELCKEGGDAFNTFLIAEDVPLEWDNWDIDADLEYKYKPVKQLLSREIVSDGAVEFRIRSKYQITTNSTLTQDMIFYADSPLVLFDTMIDWQDHHRFLKVSYDTALQVNEARHEMQFGYVKRPTTRNNSIEKAQFEVCAHKYSDLSEMRYGISLINDCKYGVSTEGSCIRLSLHKGGNRPDEKGDKGIHFCTYAFLPHNGGFSAERVVKPAYLINYQRYISNGSKRMESLLSLDIDHVIVETVKPCEDEQNAFILRLYECEGAYGEASLFVREAVRMQETDLLERSVCQAVEGERISLCFKPFEIRTVKVNYR